MPIISVRDNENSRCKRSTKSNKNPNKDRKEQGGAEAIVTRSELTGFVVLLSFLQLICNASLILKSNVELALSITLKQRKLYQPKYVAVECR